MSEHKQELPEVDVEQIMREIREEVRSQYHEPLPEFDEVQAACVMPAEDLDLPISIVPPDSGLLQRIANEAQYVKGHFNVPYYRNLGKGAKSFVKRVIRKLGKPVIFPLSEQQNELNLHVANGIDAAHLVADYHQMQLNETQNALNLLYKECERLNAQLQQQRENIAVYNRMIQQSSYLQYVLRTAQESHEDGSHHVLERDIYSDNQLRAQLLNLEKGDSIEPAFSKPDVTVVFAASDSYAKYLGPLIQSILENSSEDRTYDLIVFETNMSCRNMNLLSGLVSPYENVVIRFVDVTNIIDMSRFKFKEGSVYNYFAMLRLAMPIVMARYSKVLYLDTDTIVNADLSELYDTDINGYCLAGTRDINIYLCGLKDPHTAEYLYSLGIKQFDTYMQSGVLVMNIAEMRKQYPEDFFLQKAYEQPYTWVDQDIFNKYCRGKIKYIDMRWDMFVLYDELVEVFEQGLDEALYNEYTKARNNPKVIHYVAKRLPDLYPTGDMAAYYWRYARHTPFYENLLYS